MSYSSSRAVPMPAPRSAAQIGRVVATIVGIAKSTPTGDGFTEYAQEQIASQGARICVDLAMGFVRQAPLKTFINYALDRLPEPRKIDILNEMGALMDGESDGRLTNRF